LTNRSSPFFDFYSAKTVEEAPARALGRFFPDDPFPSPQLGVQRKFTTPGVQATMAERPETERGYRWFRGRHPMEIVLTQICRMITNGCINPDMLINDDCSEDDLPVLTVRAMISADHASYALRSSPVFAVRLVAENDDCTALFFKTDRTKLQRSMMAATTPVYMSMGMAEAKDTSANVEQPLIGVAGQLLFEKTVRVQCGPYDFKVRVTHCGGTSLGGSAEGYRY
jgi:hypothetical protein